MTPAKIASRIARRIRVSIIGFAALGFAASGFSSLRMHRPEIVPGVCAERLEHQVPEFTAELGDRPARAVVEQKRSNRSLNRKCRQPRIDGREYSGANSFLDQRCEKIEPALARS